MPSVLYSTHCSIENEQFRLKIYVDDETIRTTSDEFHPIDIPIDFIRPFLSKCIQISLFNVLFKQIRIISR